MYSDARLKTDVRALATAMDILDSLRIIEYKYKKGLPGDDNGKHHVGVFAQDLQKVMPSSVFSHSSGYLQLDPSELIFVLVKAVQDLSRKVEDLENR